MLRTYPLHTTGPRRAQSLRDVVRRLEAEIAATPAPGPRRPLAATSYPRNAF